MVAEKEIFDITIIGGGPVGLYALYYAGLRDTKAKLLEALDEVGGGLKVLYPEKYIYDVAGYPQILARDLVQQFEKQARAYKNPVQTGQRVLDLCRRDDGIIELETSDQLHLSRTVIICSGMGAFIPRKIDVPNLEKYEDHGIYYYVKDSAIFRDKKVLIAGGGDSAIDNALLLEKIAAKISLIHRNDRFRAHEKSVEELKASSIELYYPFWEVKEIIGEDHLEAVRAVNTFTGEEMLFEIDALILNLGFLTNLKPLKKWGLELEMNAIKVDESMRTNIPGIFAAGDIVHHPGKLKLIATGAGEAAIAVNNAVHLLDPGQDIEPGHSSHIGPPQR